MDDKLHYLDLLFKEREAAKQYFKTRNSLAEQRAAKEINDHYNRLICNEIKAVADDLKE